MSLPDLEIRPYRPGDEHAILATFNRVFREVCGPDYQDRTLEQWRWQYLANPHGHRISLAVAPDGTVVSQYAGVPMVADTPYGAQTFLHCVDSMTHPDWRTGLKRPGIFVLTGWPFSAHSRRIGDAVLYGFPVDVAFRIGTRYLEYHFLRVIDYLVRPVPGPAIVLPADVTVARVDAVPPDVLGLYEAFRRDKGILLRRDYRYLDWRYLQNPARGDYEVWAARRAGRLCGLLVLKPRQGLAPDAATIADWMAAPDDAGAVAALLHVATTRAAAEGRQRLLGVFPDWSAEAKALLGHQFAWTPSSTWMERRLVYLITGSPITEADLQTRWWYALGDSDLA